MTGITAVSFFCLQLVAVIKTFQQFRTVASRRHHFEYQAHERRFLTQFFGVVIYILINITSNILGVINTTETNDNVNHFLWYLIP